MKKVLLLEPNYQNKYPPIGLMKFATYYRNLGYSVRFFKGDLKELAATLLFEDFLYVCNFRASGNFIGKYASKIIEYIKIGKYSSIEKLENTLEIFNIERLKNYRQRYKLHDFPKFDTICVTTLFTFYWKETIDTINFSKHFLKSKGEFLIGGVAATILPKEIKKETGIKPHIGIYSKIDKLPLDYSILNEIDYKYPANNAYYAYMTRGCINKCIFCAVPTLEPKYKNYISLSKSLRIAEENFGTRRNLLLLDNNVFASNKFDTIVDEIKKCGFAKNAKYTAPNEYEIAITKLEKKFNERSYIKQILEIYEQISENLPESERGDFYLEREKRGLLYFYDATRESILDFDTIVKPIVANFNKRSLRTRYIDFNQGVDARLATEEKIKKLSEINIRPLRIAFDNYLLRNVYENAVRLAAKYKITNLSNYLLYNFNDKPKDLYYRMKLNIDLCEELKISIYSFPMKYHPISDPKYFKNRDFIGKHWNKKFVRAVQAVLNATKGKIGRGKDFFEEAFGKNEHEFEKILWMPEAFIINRFKYKDNLTKEWWRKFCALKEEPEEQAKSIIGNNVFTDDILEKVNPKIRDVLGFYRIKR